MQRCLLLPEAQLDHVSVYLFADVVSPHHYLTVLLVQERNISYSEFTAIISRGDKVSPCLFYGVGHCP